MKDVVVSKMVIDVYLPFRDVSLIDINHSVLYFNIALTEATWNFKALGRILAGYHPDRVKRSKSRYLRRQAIINNWHKRSLSIE